MSAGLSCEFQNWGFLNAPDDTTLLWMMKKKFDIEFLKVCRL